MNKRLLSFTIIAIFAFFIFRGVSYSNKNFAPVGNTNAPNETSCARSGCHSSFSLQQNMMDRISITANGVEVDANFTYTANTTYNMRYEILQPKSRNGFSLTVLNASNQFVGTLAAPGAPNAQLSNGSGANSSRKYVGHTNTSAVSVWDFTWTAPSDSQVISFYATSNLSNNNDNTNGDSILAIIRTFTMESSSDTIVDTTGTAIFSRNLIEELTIINNPTEKQNLQFSLEVVDVKSFSFELYDLNGKQMIKDERVLHTGKQIISIPVEVSNGLYILKVSSQGRSASYKVLL
jgi:hypothetical protein